jgi:hypothetical protein
MLVEKFKFKIRRILNCEKTVEEEESELLRKWQELNKGKKHVFKLIFLHFSEIAPISLYRYKITTA